MLVYFSIFLPSNEME